jgi:hypothetical protein
MSVLPFPAASQAGEDMFVLLGAVVAAAVVGVGFLVVMVRRDEPHLGLYGIASLVVSGVLGTFYGALTGM